MYKTKFIIATLLVILTLTLLSCYKEDKDTNQNRDLSATSILIDMHSYGIKNFKKKEIIKRLNNYNETSINTIEVEYANGVVKNFNYESNDSYIKLYETTGDKRELFLSDSENDLTLKKNGIVTTTKETLFDDMFVASYVAIGGDIDKVDAPTFKENGCVHSAISIRGRKSVTIQNIIDSFLNDHKECKQIGGVDSYCIFGDFGCFSVSEISCPSSSSTCK